MHPYYNNYTVNLAKQQVPLMNRGAENKLLSCMFEIDYNIALSLSSSFNCVPIILAYDKMAKFWIRAF